MLGELGTWQVRWVNSGRGLAVVASHGMERRVRGPLSSGGVEWDDVMVTSAAGLKRARGVGYVVLVGEASTAWRDDTYQTQCRVGVMGSRWMAMAVPTTVGARQAKALQRFGRIVAASEGLTSLETTCVAPPACGGLVDDYDLDGMAWCKRHRHHPLGIWTRGHTIGTAEGSREDGRLEMDGL